MVELAEKFIKKKKLDGCLLSNGENSDKLKTEFINYVFKIYLHSYIKKTIVFSAMQIRKKNKRIKETEELSLNIVDPNFNEEKINYIPAKEYDFLDDIFEAGENHCNYDEILLNKELIKAISRLSDKQREIIYKCIINSESDSLVACQLGVTKQAVNKNKRAALLKLRKELRNKNKSNFYSAS